MELFQNVTSTWLQVLVVHLIHAFLAVCRHMSFAFLVSRFSFAVICQALPSSNVVGLENIRVTLDIDKSNECTGGCFKYFVLTCYTEFKCSWPGKYSRDFRHR